MKKLLFGFTAATILLVACGEPTKPKPLADGKVFVGQWTYRSLLNQPDINTDFNSLEFARAFVHLETKGTDSLVGQILWPNNDSTAYNQGLNLSGTYFLNDTTLCYFLEGFGDSTLGTAGWQYNYQGYLVPQWPEGVDQAIVLVGSIVRVKKHSCDANGNNCHPAGVVATTYMVKD